VTDEGKHRWWSDYTAALQAFGATLAVLAGLMAWLVNYHDVYADARYVLKGELRATIEALGETLDARAAAEHRSVVEERIVDLEDDIIWFSENGAAPSALRRCRKLTRAVREWNDIAKPEMWQSDRVVQRVCDQ